MDPWMSFKIITLVFPTLRRQHWKAKEAGSSGYIPLDWEKGVPE